MASRKSRKPTAPRPARPAKDTGTVPVTIPVDRALQRLWNAQKSRFDRATDQTSAGWDERYEAIDAVISHDPPLYLAGGCATEKEFFERYVGEDPRTVHLWIDVARHATPHDVAVYTATRLAEMLRYARTLAGGKITGKLPIAFDRLQIPVTRNGKSVKVPALQASTREIAAASRAETRRQEKPAQGAQAPLRAMRAALTAPALKGITAQYRDGAFAFTHVPAYALGAFGKAVAGVKVDGAEAGAPAKKAPVKKAKGATKPSRTGRR